MRECGQESNNNQKSAKCDMRSFINSQHGNRPEIPVAQSRNCACALIRDGAGERHAARERLLEEHAILVEFAAHRA